MNLLGNRLLAALNNRDQAQVRAVAHLVRLDSGHVLFHPGDVVRYAYFPLDGAVAAFHVVMTEGAAIETAMIGQEGAIGGIVSDGNLAAYARACVHHGGQFIRIASSDLEELKVRSNTVRKLLSRYADCLLAQIFQTVACNAAHTLESRAARWLIASAERTGSTDIVMTHDQFGSILGVGRSYVSRLIKKMRANGLIATRRGVITLRDTRRLQARACACDRLVRAHFDHVLAGIYPRPLAA